MKKIIKQYYSECLIMIKVFYIQFNLITILFFSISELTFLIAEKQVSSNAISYLKIKLSNEISASTLFINIIINNYTKFTTKSINSII